MPVSTDLVLQLQQSAFRVPVELSRKALKLIQKMVERQRKTMTAEVAAATRLPLAEQPAALARMVASQAAFHERLKERVDSAKSYARRLEARVDRLRELEASDDDTQFLRDEMLLLMVDYLIKLEGDTPPGETNLGVDLLAALVADNPRLEQAIDVGVYVQFSRIFRLVVHQHDTTLVAQWMAENRPTIRKLVHSEGGKDARAMSSLLEFEIHFQQFLSLLETPMEALRFSKSTLTPYTLRTSYTHAANYERNMERLNTIGGLLLYRQVRDAAGHRFTEAYAPLFSQQRWDELGQVFARDFFKVYGISTAPPLLVALLVGLSSLKTKSCHAKPPSPFDVSDGQCVAGEPPKCEHCPVCSLELEQLAHTLPHAHLVASNIPGRPVMLPNGHVFDEDRLMAYQATLQPTADDRVVDPVSGEGFPAAQMVTVFPT